MSNATRFINLTPHPVRIMATQGIVEVPPSGKVARVNTIEVPRTVYLKTEQGAVPLVSRHLSPEIVDLPDEVPEDTVLVVSSMVLEAARKARHPALHHLVVPDTGATAKRDDHGHIEYVTRLVVA